MLNVLTAQLLLRSFKVYQSSPFGLTDKQKKNPRRRDKFRVYDGGNSYERNSITVSLGEVFPHMSWELSILF